MFKVSLLSKKGAPYLRSFLSSVAKYLKHGGAATIQGAIPTKRSTLVAKNKSVLFCIFTSQFHLYSVLVIGILLISCADKKSPEYAAKRYLNAIKNKDWKEASKYSSREMAQSIDMMRWLNIYFELTDVKNIKCKELSANVVICTFCCSTDSLFKDIRLRKENNGEWIVHLPKAGLIY